MSHRSCTKNEVFIILIACGKTTISQEEDIFDTEGVSADVALTMYVEAVKATGGDTSSEKIIQALKKIKVETPAGVFSFRSDGLGIGDLYVMKVTKLQDRLDWAVADKYSQIELDAPK